MKLKEEPKKWLMLVMLFVTNYVNSEHFSRQEREISFVLTPKSFESEPRENYDPISTGRAKNTLLQSRIRHPNSKFPLSAIKMRRQISQFTNRMDGYTARQNTAAKTREEYPHVFGNINSVRTLNLEVRFGNNERLSDGNQRQEMFRKRHISRTYQIVDSLGKNSGKDDLNRARNIEAKTFERRQQDRFCTRGNYQINKLSPTKSKRDDFRDRNARATYQKTSSPTERKSVQFRETNTREIYQPTYTSRKGIESLSEHVKRNAERFNTRERIFRETGTKDVTETFLYRSKMTLIRNGKIIREGRTVHVVGRGNTRFQILTESKDSRIAKEQRIINNRMLMRTERRLNEKSLENRNRKRERTQKLRSLNTNNNGCLSSIVHETREGRSAKATLENRNLKRSNLENRTYEPLFKNVETHEVSRERIRQERTARKSGKRSENEKQRRNPLVEGTGRFQLDRKNRKAMLSERVSRLGNFGSRDGKQIINDADRNIQGASIEATKFDRILTTQRNKRIRDSIFKERSAETIGHEKNLEYEINRVHKKRINARKQAVRDIRSARTFRLGENQEEIIESKSTLDTVTDYKVTSRNEKLHNRNRISKTNFIEKRNKQSPQNVQFIETVRGVEKRSTKSRGNRNMGKIDRDSRTILGENDYFRRKLVDNAKQPSESDEIEGKISIRSVRNVAKRSVKDIKERRQVDQRNRKLQGNVQVLGSRILTTINTEHFSMRENKNRGARSNEQISVSGKKQERMPRMKRNGRGFRRRLTDTGNPTRENENTVTQRNLEFRERDMDFIQHIGIKNIQIRHLRRIIKESGRRLQTKVRGLGIQPTEIKVSPTNAESRKANKISNQNVSNIRRLLIKDRREGINTESYSALSRTLAEARKMVKNSPGSVERMPIQNKSARSVTEQRSKTLQRNEKYRKMDNILEHSSSNDEKWSRERNGREFRRKMARFESQATETNRKRFEPSAVELYSTNKVIIPKFRHSSTQSRNLISSRKQNNLAFFPSRKGRGVHGKTMKQELGISNFDTLFQLKITDYEKPGYSYRYSSTPNRNLNIIRFSNIVTSRKAFEKEQRRATGESHSARNVRQYRKRQMITANVPTAEKRFSQQMRKTMRRPSDSELVIREARISTYPIQQLKTSSTTSNVQSEPGLGQHVSHTAREAHRKLETRQDIPSYSSDSHEGSRSENRQKRSRILHFITGFSFKHEYDDVQNQKLERNLPSSLLPSELNLLSVRSSRSARNSQSSRKIDSSFNSGYFPKQASYRNGRSRQMFYGSQMRGNIRMLVHSALGLDSMSSGDIFQKYKTIPIPFQVHRTSEVSANSQNYWNTRGMSSTSFIFNSFLGMLILFAMSGENRPKPRTYKERFFDFLFLRS